jgi:hypothetical protein
LCRQKIYAPKGGAPVVQGTDIVVVKGYTWTGAADDDWANAKNWKPEGVPGKNDTAVIPALPAGGRYPVVRSAAHVGRLDVQKGAKLSIEAPIQVTRE